MQFVTVDLDASHLPYLREQLRLHAEYGRILGRLLKGLDLDNGRAWAMVPAERADQAVADLEGDSIRTEERDALALEIASLLRRRLDGSPDLALTIEYWTATYLDRTSRVREFKVEAGESVFDYVTTVDSTEDIAWMLGSSLWYPTVGVIAPLPESAEMAWKTLQSATPIEHAVEHLNLVLIGAWTADGYVFWEPSAV